MRSKHEGRRREHRSDDAVKRIVVLGFWCLAAVLGAARSAAGAFPPVETGPPYTVTTTADETRVFIPLPDAETAFRTEFFHNPRRLVIEILKPSPATERPDPTAASAGFRPRPKAAEDAPAGLSSSRHPADRRLEKITAEHLSGRARYTIFFKQAVPTGYSFGRDGRTLLVAASLP